MSVFDEIAEELFGDPDERGRFGVDMDSRRRSPDGDPMTVQQLRRVQETDPYRSGNPNAFRGGHPDYDDIYECLEEIQGEWPSVRILMDGSLYAEDEWWVETVYIFYEQVEDVEEFEEWAVLSFESWLTDERKGVGPDDERVTFGNGNFRYPESDDYLLATTDEFDFYEDEEHGQYIRLWWDD